MVQLKLRRFTYLFFSLIRPLCLPKGGRISNGLLQYKGLELLRLPYLIYVVKCPKARLKRHSLDDCFGDPGHEQMTITHKLDINRMKSSFSETRNRKKMKVHKQHCYYTVRVLAINKQSNKQTETRDKKHKRAVRFGRSRKSICRMLQWASHLPTLCVLKSFLRTAQGLAENGYFSIKILFSVLLPWALFRKFPVCTH